MTVQALGVFERVFPGGMDSGKGVLANSLIISLIGFIIVFLVLGLLALFVRGMGVIFEKKNKKTNNIKNDGAAPAAPAAAAPVQAVVPEPVLEGVSEPEAAVIMALISHKSGIPLNNLQFNSIKYTEDVK